MKTALVLLAAVSLSAACVMPQAARQERDMQKNLRQIIIPEVDFRAAGICDIVAFLSRASEEYDARRVGVNIVWIPSPVPDPEAIRKMYDVMGVSSNEYAALQGVVPLTLKARRISLATALDVICDAADLEWSIEGTIVKIKRKASQQVQRGAGR